jgi:hypothetical protein
LPRSKKIPDAHEIGLPPGGDDQQGRSVEAHPLFPEIYDLLQHCFRPETVVLTLQWRYAEDLHRMPPLPSTRTIRRWRERHMPPGDLLPPSLVAEKLTQADAKVDLWQELQNVYQVAEDRLARALSTEEMLQGVPLLATDRAFLTLLRVAQQLWSVGQDLGLYPRWGLPGARVNVSQPAGNPLGEDEFTEEEIAAVAAALHEKRTGEPAPQFTGATAELATKSPKSGDRSSEVGA